MNKRIKELAKLAQERAEWMTPQGLEWFDNFKEQFTKLIVKECALIAGLMEYEGRKGIGAQILDRFEIPVSDIEAAESFHSDKGYSIGTPEAQEAFERKRGYKL